MLKENCTDLGNIFGMIWLELQVDRPYIYIPVSKADSTLMRVKILQVAGSWPAGWQHVDVNNVCFAIRSPCGQAKCTSNYVKKRRTIEQY